VSLRLAPPGPGIDPVAALRLLAALPGAALRAGWDVARRALSPGMALQPGLVPHRLGLPPGPGRDGFLALASLLPGTLPAGTPDAQGVVPIHALDTAQPIAAALARDEARYAALARGAARCAAIRRHG
jgi:multicomponent Na+:H+ antiporter subunit E